MGRGPDLKPRKIPDYGEADCKFCFVHFKRTNPRQYFCHGCYDFNKKRIGKEKLEQGKAERRARGLKKTRFQIPIKDWPEKERNAYKAKKALEWKAKNIEKVRKTRREYVKNRKSTDICYALKARVSCQMRASVLGKKKAGKSSLSYLPYTIEELRTHLERQFTKGMSWENVSEWEIDHIIPSSAFSPKEYGDEEYLACWALSNLRPLWKSENSSKKDKLIFLL